MEALELVRSFVKERLDGDIESLSAFELGNLRGDEIYGCPNRNFDSDDTELMRAIYCIVDYAKAFSDYLLSHGMSRQQLDSLVNALITSTTR